MRTSVPAVSLPVLKVSIGALDAAPARRRGEELGRRHVVDLVQAQRRRASWRRGCVVGRFARNAKDSIGDLVLVVGRRRCRPGSRRARGRCRPRARRSVRCRTARRRRSRSRHRRRCPCPTAAVAGRAGVALRAGRARASVPGQRRLAGGAGLRRGRLRVDDAQLAGRSEPASSRSSRDDAVRRRRDGRDRHRRAGAERDDRRQGELEESAPGHGTSAG